MIPQSAAFFTSSTSPVSTNSFILGSIQVPVGRFGSKVIIGNTYEQRLPNRASEGRVKNGSARRLVGSQSFDEKLSRALKEGPSGQTIGWFETSELVITDLRSHSPLGECLERGSFILFTRHYHDSPLKLLK